MSYCKSKNQGVLYIIPTPIGNLEDITLRALKVLKSVDIIVCEDTRRIKTLLAHYGVESKQLIVQHQYNEKEVVPYVIAELKLGKSIALTTDAGTPLIDDPGYPLVKSAIAEGIKVIPLPGASALLSALVGSGLACDRFFYTGFLPRKKGRKTRLWQLRRMAQACGSITIIFYEAPHRLIKLLSELELFFGNEVELCVARELTKIYEHFVRGKLKDVKEFFDAYPEKIKGEIVIVMFIPKKHNWPQLPQES